MWYVHTSLWTENKRCRICPYKWAVFSGNLMVTISLIPEPFWAYGWVGRSELHAVGPNVLPATRYSRNWQTKGKVDAFNIPTRELPSLTGYSKGKVDVFNIPTRELPSFQHSYQRVTIADGLMQGKRSMYSTFLPESCHRFNIPTRELPTLTG